MALYAEFMAKDKESVTKPKQTNTRNLKKKRDESDNSYDSDGSSYSDYSSYSQDEPNKNPAARKSSKIPRVDKQKPAPAQRMPVVVEDCQGESEAEVEDCEMVAEELEADAKAATKNAIVADARAKILSQIARMKAPSAKSQQVRDQEAQVMDLIKLHIHDQAEKVKAEATAKTKAPNDKPEDVKNAAAPVLQQPSCNSAPKHDATPEADPTPAESKTDEIAERMKEKKTQEDEHKEAKSKAEDKKETETQEEKHKEGEKKDNETQEEERAEEETHNSEDDIDWEEEDEQEMFDSLSQDESVKRDSENEKAAELKAKLNLAMSKKSEASATAQQKQDVADKGVAPLPGSSVSITPRIFSDLWILVGGSQGYPDYMGDLLMNFDMEALPYIPLRLRGSVVKHAGPAVASILQYYDDGLLDLAVNNVLHGNIGSKTNLSCITFEGKVRTWPDFKEPAHVQRMDNINTIMRAFGSDGNNLEDTKNKMLRHSFKHFCFYGFHAYDSEPVTARVSVKMDVAKYKHKQCNARRAAMTDSQFVHEVVAARESYRQPAPNGIYADKCFNVVADIVNTIKKSANPVIIFLNMNGKDIYSLAGLHSLPVPQDEL